MYINSAVLSPVLFTVILDMVMGKRKSTTTRRKTLNDMKATSCQTQTLPTTSQQCQTLNDMKATSFQTQTLPTTSQQCQTVNARCLQEQFNNICEVAGSCGLVICSEKANKQEEQMIHVCQSYQTTMQLSPNGTKTAIYIIHITRMNQKHDDSQRFP